jgi:hypothetical protein
MVPGSCPGIRKGMSHARWNHSLRICQPFKIKSHKLPKRCQTIVSNFENLVTHAANTAGLIVPRCSRDTVQLQFDRCENDMSKLSSDKRYERWNKLHGKDIFCLTLMEVALNVRC